MIRPSQVSKRPSARHMSKSGPTIEIGGNIAIASAPARIERLAGEVEARDRVGGQGREHDRDHCRDQRDPDRVDQRCEERAVEPALEQALVVVEGPVLREELGQQAVAR